MLLYSLNKATKILDQKYQKGLDGAFIEMSRKNLKLGIGVLNEYYSYIYQIQLAYRNTLILTMTLNEAQFNHSFVQRQSMISSVNISSSYQIKTKQNEN